MDYTLIGTSYGPCFIMYSALFICALQVAQEVAKMQPGLSVSSNLQFSSPEVEDQFHRWMDQRPAVRWHPVAKPVISLAILLDFYLRTMSEQSENECNWVLVALGWPGLALGLTCIALQGLRTSKQAQSLCSMLCVACGFAVTCRTLALNDDPCFVSLRPRFASVAANAASASVTAMSSFVLAPCTMQHLDALCTIVGLGTYTTWYIIYAQRVQNGRWTLRLDSFFESDDLYNAHAAISTSTIATVLVGVSIRYRLAYTHRTDFVKTLKPHMH